MHGVVVAFKTNNPFTEVAKQLCVLIIVCCHSAVYNMYSHRTATRHDHQDTKEDTHVWGGVVECLYHEVMAATNTIKANKST